MKPRTRKHIKIVIDKCPPPSLSGGGWGDIGGYKIVRCTPGQLYVATSLYIDMYVNSFYYIVE